MAEPRKEKKKLGFQTPAGDVQDRFEELQKLLTDKKRGWRTIMGAANKGSTEFAKQVVEAGKSNDVQRYYFLLEQYALMTIMNSIAALGLELSETHARLAKCEKNIEELKLRTK